MLQETLKMGLLILIMLVRKHIKVTTALNPLWFFVVSAELT